MAPRRLSPRHLLTTLAAALVAALALPTGAAAQGPTGADSAWVWSWGDQGEGASEAADSLADDAASEGLGRVALYVQGGFDMRARAAIEALSERGIAVEALAGERDWGTPRGRADMLAFVRSARAYDRGAPAAGLAGVHLDVEPWGMDRWDGERRRLLSSYMRSVADARRAAGPLRLTIDIPLAFESTPMPPRSRDRSAAAGAIRRSDAVALMAYRDDASRVIADSRAEIRMAARLGRPAWIGLETAEAVGEPESITFFEEGREALELAIADIRAGFGGSAGFRGLIVHHLGSLGELGP